MRLMHDIIGIWGVAQAQTPAGSVDGPWPKATASNTNSARARHETLRVSHDNRSHVHMACVVVLDAPSASNAANDAAHAIP